MNISSVAPCGIVCDLCHSYQRDKNKCAGCTNIENKRYHCNNCLIKNCGEKNSKLSLCSECLKFPCMKIRNLDVRYRTKFNESNIDNLQSIKENGLEYFLGEKEKNWKCKKCGVLLCVHRVKCLSCGEANPHAIQE